MITTKEEKTEKEEIFEKTQKRVIKWFLEKDIPMHLLGFKYIAYILSKRLTGEWNGENLVKEYQETAKVFETSKTAIERAIRNFRENNGIKCPNSEYLAKIFYTIKIEE